MNVNRNVDVNVHADANIGVRGRPVLVVALACVLLVGGATAQTLRLGENVRAPQLGDVTWPRHRALGLEREIVDLQTLLDAAPQTTRDLLQARINLRIIAADLLNHGDAEGARGSPAIVTGATLAHGLNDLDAALIACHELAAGMADRSSIDPAQTRRIETAAASIATFNADVVRLGESVRVTDPRQLDSALARILDGLTPVAELHTGAAVASCWPVAAAEVASSPEKATPPAYTIDELRIAFDARSLPVEVRGALAGLLEMMGRAATFPDLQNQVHRCRRVLSSAETSADALDAAAVLDDPTRARLLDRQVVAIARFCDPATRDAGEAALAMIDRIVAAAQSITAIEASDRPMPELREAVRVVVAGEGPRPGMHLLERVIERMQQRRRIDEPDLRRDLRGVYRQIERAYAQAERVVLEQIVELVGDDARVADPATEGLLSPQRRNLDDLLLVGRTSAWIEAVRAIDPPSAQPATVRLRRLIQDLPDAGDRGPAIRSLRAFESQLSRFHPLPAEEALRRADPLMMQATGGQHAALLAELEQQRRMWIGDWANDAGDASITVRMTLLERLCRAMNDTAAVFRLGGDASALNAWAAWEVQPSSMGGAIARVPGRLKLATQAAVNREVRELQQQLDAMKDDLPLARLVGRLAASVHSHLATLPAGASGRLSQLVHGPTRDALLAEHRFELAELCRYALEEDLARSTGQAAVADEIAQFMRERTESLLARCE